MVNGKMIRILSLGLNPAVQNTMIFDEFRKGEVNRANTRAVFAGGKGANFARALKNWGGTGIVAQFTGGATGAEFNKHLSGDDIESINQQVEAPTRTCSTLICAKTHSMTEVIEPSGAITRKEADALAARIADEIPKCSGVALCGTWPPGIEASFYANAAKIAKRHGIPLLLDAFKGVEPVIAEGIDILKINVEELTALAGMDDIRAAGLSILKRYPLKHLAITDGPRTAWLFSEGGMERLDVPKVDNPLNPIGAGDTVSAVLFAEYLSGAPLKEAFAKGLQAASDSCRELKPAQFSIRR
jgi:1-phosphofructokinase